MNSLSDIPQRQIISLFLCFVSVFSSVLPLFPSSMSLVGYGLSIGIFIKYFSTILSHFGNQEDLSVLLWAKDVVMMFVNMQKKGPPLFIESFCYEIILKSHQLHSIGFHDLSVVKVRTDDGRTTERDGLQHLIILSKLWPGELKTLIPPPPPKKKKKKVCNKLSTNNWS